MTLLLTCIQKEMRHILRDGRTLLILFGMPIVQILLFGFALSNEVKNAHIAVFDMAHDDASQLLIERMNASAYFDVVTYLSSPDEIENVLRASTVKMVLVIPNQFHSTLLHNHDVAIQVIADGSDPNVATTLINYATAIVNDYQMEMNTIKQIPYAVTIQIRMLYNPQMKGAYNYVPGMMAMVLMLVCVLMTSISIVREKELGTMEILLVSPMRPAIVMIAKMIPYLLLSMGIVVMILLLSVYVLDVPIVGSLTLLLAESFLFVVVCLAIGLVISNATSSQQVAMLIALMVMMMPTVMLSGFMFPIENFPLPLQWVAGIIPAKWFFTIINGVMIKGLPLEGVYRETLVLCGMAMFYLFIGIRTFKTQLA